MLASLLRTRTLILKEFLVILRDRWGRQMLIVPPIIQLLLFSSAVTLEVRNVALMVQCDDQGRHGLEFARRLGASRRFSRVGFAADSEEMAGALERREILSFLHIPADFSRRVAAGGGAVVEVVHDGRRSNAAQVVNGYLAEMANQYAAELGDPEAVGLKAAERHWFNPNLDHQWTTIPSLVAILTLIMSLTFSALSLSREKETGTFEQLLVTPFRPMEILVGKLVPAMAVGVLDSHLVFVLGRIIFGVPFRGDYPVFLLSVVLYSFSVVGFGLMVSSIARTQQQAILGAFMFMVPAIALSGFAAPFENMPWWLQKAMWLNPMKHAVIVFKGLFLKAPPLSVVLGNAWPMVVIGVATMLAASVMFRRSTS
jgi:ABC-2 type transport system permease protein